MTNRSCEISCEAESCSEEAVLWIFPFDDRETSVVDDEDEEAVCIRRLAVSTNWPTAAEKPARNALKG